MKRSIFVLVAVLALVTATASAQTATGTLAITAAVAPSISLTINTNGSGPTLTGSGTAAASLALGNIFAYGTAPATGITRTLNGVTDFTYSFPFDVVVAGANSANFSMTAAIGSNTTNGVSYNLGATGLSTTAAPVETAQSYGTRTYTLNLNVPFAAPAGDVSRTITFTATAN